MKTHTLFTSILLLLFGVSLSAQDLSGQWLGTLQLPMGKLRLVFHLSPKADGYTATMDSPDQGAKGIPVSLVTFNAPTLTLEVAAAQIKYTGTYENNRIKGTFVQGGLSLPLELSKSSESVRANRPQEPTAPYPYHSEEVTFENPKAGVKLAGTLTLPQTGSNFPVAVLITGSGKQNRDEEILGHKPFLVIADYLTRNGIAVLRYDDRGVAGSTGNFDTATTADFAEDAASAVAYLRTRKEINPHKIGLIGHSEGGMIAPMVASASKEIGFIVLLAGVGIKGDELMLLQKQRIEEKMGYNAMQVASSRQFMAGAYQVITQTTDSGASLRDSVARYLTSASLGSLPKEQITAISEQITTPWFVYLLRFDPAAYLRKVTCPVLALNGSKDLQVPPKENLSRIQSSIESNGNKRVTTIELENLNHLFQECNTGLPAEYATIEQTCSPRMLEAVNTWLGKLW
ncbi:MAG: alpha/beta fold hydrolase [Bacteroides sp.]|uniref:alpha/beta hydrolase family protein n=1 Tax=Bacteroides sp. TaxID=29523 RepID=UPI002FC75AA5